jgi:hypothetical protein
MEVQKLVPGMFAQADLYDHSMAVHPKFPIVNIQESRYNGWLLKTV